MQHVNATAVPKVIRPTTSNKLERRAIELAEHITVTEANLENGLLQVELVRETPDEKNSAMHRYQYEGCWIQESGLASKQPEETRPAPTTGRVVVFLNGLTSALAVGLTSRY